MNVRQLQTRVHYLGVKHSRNIVREQTLVRSIQAAQGHPECFQTDLRYLCKDQNCEWKRECKKLIAEWLR